MTEAKPKSILLALMDVDPSHEDEFNRWYDEEHLPERMACPGFLSGRRYISVEGAPKYLAIYELEGPEALQSEEYQRVKTSSPWRDKTQAYRTSSIRNVYVEIPSTAIDPTASIDELLRRRTTRL